MLVKNPPTENPNMSNERRGRRGGRDSVKTALVIALRDLDSSPVLMRF